MSRRMLFTLVFCVFASFKAPAGAQTPEEEEEYAACDEAVRILRGKIISLDFTDAPIRAVVRHFAQSTGLNVVLDPAAEEVFDAEQRTVTLQLADLPAWDALQVFLKFNDLALIVKPVGLLVTTPDRVPLALSTRVYDLSGMLRRIPDRPGDVRDLLRPYSVDRTEQEKMEPGASAFPDPEALIARIRESVAPDSWNGEGSRIELSGTRMVVTHTREAHEEIRNVLNSLDACLGPPIGIRARVLRVLPAALDGIGPGPLLSDAEVRALEAAAAGLPQDFPDCRVAAVNGFRNHFAAGRDFPYLSEKTDGRPSVKFARDGIVLEVRPFYARGPGVPAVVRFFAATGGASPEKLARMPFFKVGTAVVVPRDGWLLLSAGTVRPAADGAGEETAVVVLLTAEAGPWPVPESFLEKPTPDIGPLKALFGRKMTVDYKDVPLQEVAADFRKRMGINVLIDPKVRKSKSEDKILVDLTVSDVPAGEVLSLVAAVKGLACVLENGVVVLRPQEGAQARAALGFLPAHDLIARVPRFDAEWRALPSSQTVSSAAEESREDQDSMFTGEGLLEFVKRSVSPETWDYPPNEISIRHGHLIARNQPSVLAGVNATLDSLRKARWRRVQVDGRFLAAPAGWAEGLRVRGAVLTAAQCDAVEKALACSGPPVRDRFRVHGCVGRRFAISGGRQIVFAEDARDATDFGTAAAVDGWCGQFEAVPATERGKMTLSVLARASSYSPPARPFEESGTMWVAEYVADLGLEDGGGALLGSASAGDAREGAWLLFLRARFVE